MRAFVLCALVGCATSSATATSDPVEPATEEPVTPEPATEPSDEPVTEDPATEPAIPTSYFIEGEEVDRATFETRFAQLTVEAEPIEAETVENEDGSYGGSGATYVAREGEREWLYSVVSFNEMDGSVRESRSLRAR